MRRFGWGCTLSLLVAAFGCGGPRGELPPRVIFARDGVFVPTETAAEFPPEVTLDNAIVILREPQVTAAGLFFPHPWQPGGHYTFRFRSRDGSVRVVDGGLAPVRPEPVVVGRITLEEVHAGSVISGGEPDAALAFSADGTLLALGTFGGYLRLFEAHSGKCVFEKRFPGAVIKRVAVSTDNTRVYAGEMSYDGFVSAFEIGSGRMLWRFRLADELETSRPARADDYFALYSYPQAFCMRVVGDDLLVAGCHSWREEDKPRHLCRMYRFDGRTGRVLWRWPADAPVKRNISWFDVGGGKVLLGAYQWEKPAPDDAFPQAAVCLLDVSSGRLLDRHVFESLTPYFDTVPMWYGLALDGAGHAAAGLMDGRAVLFNVADRLEPVRQIGLATPVEVTGVPIYAGVGWAAGSGKNLYLLTGGRLVAPSASSRGESVRADHFNSNMLFAFNGASGKLLWQWKLTTAAQGVAAGRDVVAVSTQQSCSSDDPMDYGLTVFDASLPGAPVEKLLFRYHTAGPIVALAVSPDGKTIAAVEAAVRLPDGMTVVGKYRLHILR